MQVITVGGRVERDRHAAGPFEYVWRGVSWHRSQAARDAAAVRRRQR
jgi:uncharacterized membrane protein YeiB